MFSPRQVVSSVAFCVFGFPLFAQQQDGPAVNAAVILQELNRIEQTQKLALQSSQQSIMSQLQEGASNGSAAANLYVIAKKAVDFQGMRGDTAAFQQWKKDNDVLIHNKDMQAQLVLQLRYLVLSMQAKTAANPQTLLTPTLGYVQDLMATRRMLQQEEMAASTGGKSPGPALTKEQNAEMKKILKDPLDQCLFVRWLDLGSWLPDKGKWELSPGNVAGIFDKDIRPILRDGKSAQLVDSWDQQLRFEADMATMQQLSHSADEFNNVQRPRLLYNRALDMELLGLKNRAVTEVLTLVRTYPQHPDFADWVAKIREMLTAPAATGTSPAAAPGTSR